MKIPDWIWAGLMYRHLPPEMQSHIKDVIRGWANLERERLRAESMGMTLREYHLWQFVPEENLDKFGKDYTA